MRMPKLISDLAQRMAGAQTALADLHDADRSMRHEHEQLIAERARVAASLPPRTELIERLATDVDELGSRWRQMHAAGVVAAGQPSEISTALGTSLITGVGVIDLGALCGLLPAALKEGLGAIVRGTPFEEGPARGERPRLLADLDQRIQAIEDEHSRLCGAAAQNGVSLALLEPVRSRRAHEAFHTERREREERDRARKVR